jgi:hypothetical protein
VSAVLALAHRMYNADTDILALLDFAYDDNGELSGLFMRMHACM